MNTSKKRFFDSAQKLKISDKRGMEEEMIYWIIAIAVLVIIILFAYLIKSGTLDNVIRFFKDLL